MQKEYLETYKADWEEALNRMRDWWNGRPIDRVVASVTAPKKGIVKFPVRGSIVKRYTDPETVFQNLDAELRSTFFGGESFPCHWVYLGPVPMSLYLGCEPTFHEHTVWQSPIYDNWDAVEKVSFDSLNKWWLLTCALTQRSVKRSQGLYIVSGCGVCAISDVIANMWGSERAIMAMAERPELIRALRDKMLIWFRQMYDTLYDIVAPYQDGYFDWLNLWAPGRICTLQSDISCMISPKIFNDLFLEEIRQEAKHVEYCFYHLDGPDAIKHVDALLSIEELDGIQWTPGAGASNDPMDWIDLFRHIQSADKKILIYCPPEKVRSLLNMISPKGVYLSVPCPDETTAQNVLAELDKIGY